MPRRPSLARPPARSAAKPPRSRIIVRERAANTRLFDFLIVKFLARADLLRQQHWEDDIDLAVIVGTVAVAVIEPRMRDEAFVRKYRSVDNVVGVAGQRAVNSLSVATATGIPRETARRKLKRLLALGVLTETTRGQYVLKPGYIQTAAVRRLFDQLTRDVVTFFNECLDEGLIEMSAGR